MIKAIVFDFGGVLLRTEDRTGRQQWETRLGLGARELDQLVFESDAAHRATLGAAPASAVWESVALALKLSDEQIDTLRRDFWSGDRLDHNLVALLAALRPAYQTAILSNAWPDARELIGATYGLAPVVDTLFISAEEHLSKPDLRLYQRVAERLDVAPEAIVLVDDFLANIDGARAAGWQTIHFRTGLDVHAELSQLGVEAPSAPIQKEQ